MAQKTSSPWRNFAVAGGVVFLVWLAFTIIVGCKGEDFTKSGPFGDSFGILNTLFTGLAFAGMICTLIMQKQELELQRQELADTRAELARTAKANEETAQVAKDNLVKQEELAKKSIKIIYKQILTQKIITQIDCIHKKIELTCSGNPVSMKETFKENSIAIDDLLDQLLDITHN